MTLTLGPKAAAAAAVVIVVAATIGIATLGLGGRHRIVATTKVTLASTEITRCTLTAADTAAGHVSHGSASTLPLQATGLITWLPRPRTVVREGQTLARVDDRPVVLLYGSLPQYRALHPSMITPSAAASDPPPSTPTSKSSTSAATPSAPGPTTETTVKPASHGADVTELKAALGRLHYGGFSGGDDYTDATAAAVKDWQGHLGEPRTGVVALGDVFYAPGPLRVLPAPKVTVGQPMSPAALERTSRTEVVTTTVPEGTLWARVGAKAAVVTAAGKSLAAVVSSSKPAGSTSADGGSDIALVLTVGDQAALADAGKPVRVMHVNAQHKGVLCVPTAALVGLAEGGFGLQKAGPQDPSYVAVRTGMFADGKVEISGTGVAPGLRVSLPVGD